ncbi:MAG TPA: glutathione S-transferase [Polyangiaceae bacterium]|nr:glutathione S-transferase [Polyangiaceae bacterium]
MRPVLYIGNQNYSSWSMRPWLVLRWAKIAFETQVIQLGGPGYTQRQMSAVLAISPSGTVPALHWDGEIIGDSLAISEWAAERVPTLWPRDETARAYARAATCEMHSSFGALRSKLPCNIRRRAEPRRWSEDVAREIARMEALWTELYARFAGDGPYLFGATPTIPDAFFTPVATRFRSYAVTLGRETQRYADSLLANEDFQVWEAAGKREVWSMPEWDEA